MYTCQQNQSGLEAGPGTSWYREKIFDNLSGRRVCRGKFSSAGGRQSKGPPAGTTAPPAAMSRAILLGLRPASTFKLRILTIHSSTLTRRPEKLLRTNPPNERPLLSLRKVVAIHVFSISSSWAMLQLPLHIDWNPRLFSESPS